MLTPERQDFSALNKKLWTLVEHLPQAVHVAFLAAIALGTGWLALRLLARNRVAGFLAELAGGLLGLR